MRLTAEQNSTDAVLFKVQDKTIYIITEIQELACHCFIKAMDMGDTVADLDNRADIIDIQINIVVFDLVFDDGCYFFKIHFHLSQSPLITCSPSDRP